MAYINVYIHVHGSYESMCLHVCACVLAMHIGSTNH